MLVGCRYGFAASQAGHRTPSRREWCAHVLDAQVCSLARGPQGCDLDPRSPSSRRLAIRAPALRVLGCDKRTEEER